MKTLTLAMTLLMSTQAFSKDIFLMTKSIRKKNVIRYDVRVIDCKLTKNSLTAYWTLGEKGGVRQELTPSEITKFAPQIESLSDTQIKFTLPVFREINDQIVDNPITVKVEDCEPKAYIQSEGEKILLNEIHGEISIWKMDIDTLIIKGKKSNGKDFKYKIDV